VCPHTQTYILDNKFANLNKFLVRETKQSVHVRELTSLSTKYKLTFDSPEKKDLLFETLGVKICVDRKSHLLLDGLLIDWTNDLSAPGPRFENPRATSTCGCSTSFNIKQDSTLQENKPAWLQ